MAATTKPYVYEASATLTLIPQTCCNCGVLFGMEAGFDKQRRNDRKSFSCPNGHSQYYTGATREVRRIAEGYLADVLDQVQDDTDPIATAGGLLNRAEDHKLTRDGRLVITWHLDNDGTPPRDPNAVTPL